MGKKYLTPREALKLGTYIIVIGILWILGWKLYLIDSQKILFTEFEIITVLVLGVIYAILFATYIKKVEKAKKLYIRDLILYLPLIGAPWIAAYVLTELKSGFLWFLFFTPTFLLAIGWDVAMLARDLKKRSHNCHPEIH